MLASTGISSTSVNLRYISMSVNASAKIISAPASAKATARSTAASNPSTDNASVRAMTTKSGSVLASKAAFRRSTISEILTISLFGRWPQRFCATWSSICTAATPAFSIFLMVWAILKAPPKPVSISTNNGVSTASVIRRASSSTLSRLVIPRSGKPKDALATPPPDR